MAHGPVVLLWVALTVGSCSAARVEEILRFGGVPFNGSVSIRPENPPSGQVGFTTQILVVDGELSVELPDSANESVYGLYLVEYVSRMLRYTELWSVPNCDRVLTRGNVLVGSADRRLGPSSSVPASGVTGLRSDTALRPIEGPGYTTSVVARINAQGQLEGVTGDAGACVLVDGTTGPCSVVPGFVDGETPLGTIDGTNSVFTLANVPDGASLMLFRNGLYMSRGIDYTLNDQTISFVSGGIPQPADGLIASYRVADSTRSLRNRAALAGNTSTPSLLCEASGTVPVSGVSDSSVAICSISKQSLDAQSRLIVTVAVVAFSAGPITLEMQVGDRVKYYDFQYTAEAPSAVMECVSEDWSNNTSTIIILTVRASGTSAARIRSLSVSKIAR